MKAWIVFSRRRAFAPLFFHRSWQHAEVLPIGGQFSSG